jgi:hypothetical protein
MKINFLNTLKMKGGEITKRYGVVLLQLFVVVVFLISIILLFSLAMKINSELMSSRECLLLEQEKLVKTLETLEAMKKPIVSIVQSCTPPTTVDTVTLEKLELKPNNSKSYLGLLLFVTCIIVVVLMAT